MPYYCNVTDWKVQELDPRGRPRYNERGKGLFRRVRKGEEVPEAMMWPPELQEKRLRSGHLVTDRPETTTQEAPASAVGPTSVDTERENPESPRRPKRTGARKKVARKKRAATKPTTPPSSASTASNQRTESSGTESSGAAEE